MISSVPKVTIEIFLGVFAIIVAVILYLLDRAGKGNALINVVLLLIVAALLLYPALNIPWIRSSPENAIRIWRAAVAICFVILPVWWFGIWTWPGSATIKGSQNNKTQNSENVRGGASETPVSTAVTSSGGELHLRVGQMKGFDRAFDVSGTGKVDSQIDSMIGPNNPTRPPSPIAPDPEKLKTVKSRVRELNGQILDFLAQRKKNEPPQATSEMEELFRRSDKESVEAFTKAFVKQSEITQQYANETSAIFAQQFAGRMAVIRDELAGVGLKSDKLDEVLADDLRLQFEIQEAAEELQRMAKQVKN